jgi:hypothetical protein
MCLCRNAKAGLTDETATIAKRRDAREAQLRATGALQFWCDIAPAIATQPPDPEPIIERFQLLVSVYGAKNMRNIQT